MAWGPPGSAAAIFLLLLLLLLPVARPEAPTAPSGSSRGQTATPATPVTPDPTTPDLGLTFDPRSHRLSWRCPAGGGGRRRRGRLSEDPARRCSCDFQGLEWHRGAEFEVTLALPGGNLSRGLVFGNPGPEGSAAVGLACHVFEARTLNCSWAPGPRAPPGTRYNLGIRDARTGRYRECRADAAAAGPPGPRLGCALPDLAGLRARTYALVTGSSPAGPVRFLDAWLYARDIERFDPPRNVSVACGPRGCRASWAPPRTWRRLSDRDFQYQLDLSARHGAQPASRDPPIEVPGGSGNSYALPGLEPGPRRALRIRAGDARTLAWGAWSRAVEFGSAVSRVPAGRAALPPLLAAAALGSLLASLGLGWGCRRLLGARVPRVRDKVTGGPDQVRWEDFASAASASEAREEEEEAAAASPVEELSARPGP